MLPRRAACAVLITLLPLGSETHAQLPSCSGVQAIAGAMGYQQRSAAPRCEGFYQSPVAGESLEILSLVVGAIAYDLTADKILVIAVPEVSRLEVNQVNVAARALPLGTYYRMDASVDSGGSLRWPLATVIAPARLYADTIGVIGWVRKGSTRIYVPVTVFSDGHSSDAKRPATAVLRSSVDIEKILWRSWVEGGGMPPQYHGLQGANPRMVRAGEPVAIPVDGPEATVVILEVAAKMANADNWITNQFRVFNP